MSEKKHYRCPNCDQRSSRVFDSRPIETPIEPTIRRRRKCTICDHRWSTYEITDTTYYKIQEAVASLEGIFGGMSKHQDDGRRRPLAASPPPTP
jgi:hypothetical protein